MFSGVEPLGRRVMLRLYNAVQAPPGSNSSAASRVCSRRLK